MSFFLLAIAVGTAVAGWFAYRQINPQKALPAHSGPTERTIFNLQVGNIVQHLGTDYTVDSTLVYEESGFKWSEFLLGGGDGDRWLSVEEDDRVVVALSEEIEDLAVEGTPPKTVNYRNMSFKQTEHGKAQVTRTQKSGTQTLSCEFWDYKGPDDHVLSVEDWGSEREISFGRRVLPSTLSILG